MEELTIITPVGPGHEDVLARCVGSVEETGIRHIVIDDTDGVLGRSNARNIALDSVETKWVMFLDADDELASGVETKILRAIEQNPDCAAIFDSIYGVDDRGHLPKPLGNVYPHTNTDIMAMPVYVKLFSISGVFLTDCARKIGFHPDLDRSETVEFALALCSAYPDQWVKVPDWFTIIHCEAPSATGPRGYGSLDWIKEVQPVFKFWKRRKMKPMTRIERFATRYREC